MLTLSEIEFINVSLIARKEYIVALKWKRKTLLNSGCQFLA
jgi:hypothetical protein